MKIKKIFFLTKCAVISLFFISEAQAQVNICGKRYNPNNNLTGDNFIVAKSSSNRAFHRETESLYNMQDWQVGRGGNYSDLNADGTRIMNALWVLKNAGGFRRATILTNAHRWAGDRMDKLQPTCSTPCGGSSNGCNMRSKKFPSGHNYNRVYIDKDFLFASSHVLSRAALLYHEARHSDAHWRDASKHKGWENKDAYAAEVIWLAWFAADANPIFPDSWRAEAARLANKTIRNRGFNIPPIIANTGPNKRKLVNGKSDRLELPQFAPVGCSTPNLSLFTVRSNAITSSHYSEARAKCGTCGVRTGSNDRGHTVNFSCGVGGR